MNVVVVWPKGFHHPQAVGLWFEVPSDASNSPRIKAHAAFESHRKAIRGLHYWQGTHRCGVQFYNTERVC